MDTAFSLADFLPDTSEIVIVHIGASLGEADAPEPYLQLVARKRARVIGFEPSAEEHARLLAQKREGETYLPYFIGKGGPATYHETNHAMTGSLLEPNAPLLERFFNLSELVTLQARHPVTTHALDSIPELADIDFLKIDVQGGELDVFQGASKTLSRCVLIHTEVEFVQLYKNQPLFADVDTCLRGHGFQFHTFRGFSGRFFKSLMRPVKPRGHVNQLLWSDAVYVTDFMALERLETDKLKKLAILLHDIYQSVDLCMVVLAELDRRAGADRILQLAYGQRLSAPPAT